MNKKPEYNYNTTLKRFFLTTAFVFLGCCCIIFYIKLSLVAEQFADNVKTNINSIEKDFQRLQRIYQAQLTFAKSRIEHVYNDPQKLRDFLDDTQILIEVGSNINTIIVTDKDFKLITSGQTANTATPSVRLDKGNYRNILKQSPEKIILGEIVESVITKKPVIPLATGIQDKNGKMLGAIVFSINLKKLENTLSHGRLFKVFIEDNKTSLSDDEAYNKLLESPKLFFIFEILSPMNSHWGISTLEKTSQKHLHLQYNTDVQKTRFINALAPTCMIIFILLIIINLLFYFYVISPMKPAMELLNKALDNRSSSGNIFTKLTNLVVDQSSKLKEQNLLSKEQEVRLVAIRDLSKQSISSIKNISENLTEEIGDLITTQNPAFLAPYKELLEEIQHKITNNEESTKLILDTSVEILRLIAKETKEPCTFMKLLLDGGINETIIMESFHYSQHALEDSKAGNQITRQMAPEFMIYKNLFYKLLQEILACETKINILKEAIIKGSSIEFIFTVTDKESISAFNINLTRCKMLSVFNNMQIKCVYDRSQITVICSIHSSSI